MPADFHTKAMRRALTLAARGQGFTSPNPCVGAVITKGDRILGEGWHKQAGAAHAEVNAIRDALAKGHNTRGATIYVTLEPCSTHGRTPPCTSAILDAGIKRVIVAAEDPNPEHAGSGLHLLRAKGIKVESGFLADRSHALNQGFNHWIVHRSPFVTLKAGMTLDGKIATKDGQSKWITSEKARKDAQKLRLRSDAILVGIQTILKDNPSLTCRNPRTGNLVREKKLRRIVLDTKARTPLSSRIITDEFNELTTIVVASDAPASRVEALKRRVSVVTLRRGKNGFSIPQLLKRLGKENVTSLLVEGGGTTLASFIDAKAAHRIHFYYAPKILGGKDSRPAVAGGGSESLEKTRALTDVKWKSLDPDLLLTAAFEQS